MITNLQKRDGRFERLSIMIDHLPDVDLLENVIRDAQDHANYEKYKDNDKITLEHLLMELRELTKVKPTEL